MKSVKRFVSLFLCLLLVGALLPLAALAEKTEIVMDFTQTNSLTFSDAMRDMVRNVVLASKIVIDGDDCLYLNGDERPDLNSAFTENTLTLSLHHERSATGVFAYTTSDELPNLRIILPNTAPNDYLPTDGTPINTVVLDLDDFVPRVKLLPGEALPARSVSVMQTDPAWAIGDITAEALWYAIDTATVKQARISSAFDYWQLLNQKGKAVRPNTKVQSGMVYVLLASITLSEDSEAIFNRQTALEVKDDGPIPPFLFFRTSAKRMLFIYGEGMFVPSELAITYPPLTSRSGKLPAITPKTTGDLAAKFNVQAEWRENNNESDNWEVVAAGTDIKKGYAYQLWLAVTPKTDAVSLDVFDEDAPTIVTINGYKPKNSYFTKSAFYLRAEAFTAGEYKVYFEYGDEIEFNFTDDALTFKPEGFNGSATYDPATGVLTLNELQLGTGGLWYSECGVTVVVKGDVSLRYISNDCSVDDMRLTGDGQLILFDAGDDALYSDNSIRIDGLKIVANTTNDNDGAFYDSSRGNGLFITGKAHVSVQNITEVSVGNAPALCPRRLDLSGLAKGGVLELAGKPALSGAGAKDEYGHSIEQPYNDLSWISLPAECRIEAGAAKESARVVSVDEFFIYLPTYQYIKITSLADPVLYGDVDGNGKVNAVDALWTLQAAVNKRTLTDLQYKAANVNGDGTANAVDALLILKKAVDKLNKFPVEQ